MFSSRKLGVIWSWYRSATEACTSDGAGIRALLSKSSCPWPSVQPSCSLAVTLVSCDAVRMRSVFFGFMTAPGLTTAGGATWRNAATATRSPRFESGDSAEEAEHDEDL